ncbi:MAG: 3'(2'),5'-bisphosphate nucleotidase CysQ [Bacteroidales bacterium]|nr:3'(2'),5'-bisphosphate nucleotidase CysQ [Bacteroidales bacterium]
MTNLHNLLHVAVKAALKAGSKTLKYYKNDLDVLLKDDHSPLTLADLESNEVINKYLNQTDLPVLSEENKIMPFVTRSKWKMLWLVDPLDGTKEFINKKSDYTINIALIENSQPVLGVVFVPAKSVLYYGMKDMGSYRVKVGKDAVVESLLKTSKKIHAGSVHTKLVIVASKSHLSDDTRQFIRKLEKNTGPCDIRSYGSSLKLCMIADGSADIYPRLGPTMEWDTAASHAVAEFAGCRIVSLPARKPVEYNKRNLLNPWFVVYNAKLDSLLSKII